MHRKVLDYKLFIKKKRNTLFNKKQMRGCSHLKKKTANNIIIIISYEITSEFKFKSNIFLVLKVLFYYIKSNWKKYF